MDKLPVPAPVSRAADYFNQNYVPELQTIAKLMPNHQMISTVDLATAYYVRARKTQPRGQGWAQTLDFNGSGSELQLQEYLRDACVARGYDPGHLWALRQLAVLHNDEAQGTDHLMRTQEAEALATVLLSTKVIAPLSIGIFGEWGSGKSIFLHLLKERISQVTQQARDEDRKDFHTNVKVIEFNAWHFIDANLWAGLVPHIFEKLAEADHQDDKRQIADRRRLLFNQLESSKERVDQANRECKQAEDQLKRAINDAGSAQEIAFKAGDCANVLLEASIRKSMETYDKFLEQRPPENKEKASGAEGHAARKSVDERQSADDRRALIKVINQKFKKVSDSAPTTVFHDRLRIARNSMEEFKRIQDYAEDEKTKAQISLCEASEFRSVAGATEKYVAGQTSELQDVAKLGDRCGILAEVIRARIERSLQRERNQTAGDHTESPAEILSLLQACARLGQELDTMFPRSAALKQASENLDELQHNAGQKSLWQWLSGVIAMLLLAFVAFAYLGERTLDTPPWLRGACLSALTVLGGAFSWSSSWVRALNERLNDEKTNASRAAELARTTLEDAQREHKELTGRLAEIDTGVGFREFILERVGSDEYKQYQGVISLVRRDLEKLSNLLSKEPEEKGERSFPSRVLLVVDDLDRCPAKRVVEVLQAIHLLLAFKAFMVVVAVDARWVLQSLRQEYLGLRNEDGDEASYSSPEDYLEKIFQVPFSIPALTQDESGKLITALSDSQASLPSPSPATGGIVAPAQEISGPDLAGELQGGTISLNLAGTMQLTAFEVKSLQKGARILTSPRQTKRLMNQYLFARALVQSDYRLDKLIELHRPAVALLSLLVRWPAEAEAFCRYILSGHGGADWSEFLMTLELTPGQQVHPALGRVGDTQTVLRNRWTAMLSALQSWELDLAECREVLDRCYIGRFSYRRLH